MLTAELPQQNAHDFYYEETEEVFSKVMVNRSFNSKNTFQWTPPAEEGEYVIELAVYYKNSGTRIHAPNIINPFSYCTKYHMNMDVE